MVPAATSRRSSSRRRKDGRAALGRFRRSVRPRLSPGWSTPFGQHRHGHGTRIAQQAGHRRLGIPDSARRTIAAEEDRAPTIRRVGRKSCSKRRPSPSLHSAPATAHRPSLRSGRRPETCTPCADSLTTFSPQQCLNPSSAGRRSTWVTELRARSGDSTSTPRSVRASLLVRCQRRAAAGSPTSPSDALQQRRAGVCEKHRHGAALRSAWPSRQSQFYRRLLFRGCRR